MVIKRYKELVIRPQGNQKFTSKMRDEGETMLCGVWKLGSRALRLGLTPGTTT